MVVVVGIDVHKVTHCAVAVDEAGRQLGQPLTVRATDAGHRQLLRWARREFAEARWSSRSRTAGTCRPGWSGRCWTPRRRWCGCRRS